MFQAIELLNSGVILFIRQVVEPYCDLHDSLKDACQTGSTIFELQYDHATEKVMPLLVAERRLAKQII